MSAQAVNRRLPTNVELSIDEHFTNKHTHTHDRRTTKHRPVGHKCTHCLGVEVYLYVFDLDENRNHIISGFRFDEFEVRNQCADDVTHK